MANALITSYDIDCRVTFEVLLEDVGGRFVAREAVVVVGMNVGSVGALDRSLFAHPRRRRERYVFAQWRKLSP